MKRNLALFLLIVFLFSGCTQAETPSAPAAPEVDGYLTVHYIDVGQADCMLLISGETTILIDGGNTGDGNLVLNYMQRYGVDELDLMINTHPHGDHLGGLPTVLASTPTDAIWCSTDNYDSSTFDRFLYQADKQNVKVEVPDPGTVYTADGLTLTVLGPLGDNYKDLNDTSLVVMVEFGNRKFLFTGDMETLAENELLDADVDLKADVLKVGHHGSYSSTSSLFLQEVDPDYAIISCGRNNSYGHPHDAPLSRLEKAEVSLYRTDLMGTVVISTDGNTLALFWEMGNVQPTSYPNAA